jgi:hypothetical protein
MSQLVDLDLGDKPRQFRFNMFDSRQVCRNLSGYPGKGSVDALRLIIMLGSRDWDAWGEVLAKGLEQAEPQLKPDRALRYLQEAITVHGKSIKEIAEAVRHAGELGGVWEKTDEEDGRGNVTTPSPT